MADITTFNIGDPFIVRVRSSLATNRRVRWWNTYEMRAINAGSIEDIVATGNVIADFQAKVCYNYVYVDQFTVSSWVPDSHPYNPLGFTTQTVNQLGENPLGVKLPVALRQTLFLSRDVSTGLQGKLFLRGALSNEDIETQDGEWELVGPGLIEADLLAAMASSGLDDLIAPGTPASFFALALIGDDLETRFLTGLSVKGTADVKMNHKYFDRSPA